MNIIGNAGILNPYHNGSQYRIHILSMDQDQAATTREIQPNPNPINWKSCAGYKIITNNKNKGLEERHIETKIIIFKNITGKENIKFLTATQAIKTLNEITIHEEDKNFKTLIFAHFNRRALTNTMITNTTEKELIKEIRKIKSNKKATILQPQKCKIRKELANEIKQILNLCQTTNLEEYNPNHDTTKIGDITIKTEDRTQNYIKNNIYDTKILIESLKNISFDQWKKRWHVDYAKNQT